MKLFLPLFVFAAVSVPLRAIAAPPAPPSVPVVAKERAVVQFALHLSRSEQTGENTPSEAPAVLGEPKLTTFDGDTATIAVASPDFTYNIALSPTVQTTNGTVQVLWNLKLAGKSLPGGVTSTTMTGAARVAKDKEMTIAEITLTDPATKKRSVFRLWGTIAVNPEIAK